MNNFIFCSLNKIYDHKIRMAILLIFVLFFIFTFFYFFQNAMAVTCYRYCYTNHASAYSEPNCGGSDLGGWRYYLDYCEGYHCENNSHNGHASHAYGDGCWYERNPACGSFSCNNYWGGSYYCTGAAAYRYYNSAYCSGNGCGYSGSWQRYSAWDYLCDSSSPTMSVTPAGGTFTSTPVNYTASWQDSGSGLNSCQIQIDGTWYSLGCSGASYSYPSNFANYGFHTLLLWGRDVIGNTAYSSYYNFNINYPTPTADIKANSSDGPVYIDYNTPATLSWTSTNAVTCEASGDWSGAKGTSGSESTGSLTTDKTYNIRCQNSGGTWSILDSVDVLINEYHSVCSGNTCSLQSGVGVNSCTSNLDTCGGGGGGGDGGPNWHSACAQNACVVVDGQGANECSSDTDCGGAIVGGSYGLCAGDDDDDGVGACVRIEGSAPDGAPTCSNYGGECPVPLGSTYGLLSDGPIKINILSDEDIACSNIAHVSVAPVGGFSATVNMSVSYWDNLAYDSFILSPASIISPYGASAEFSVCVLPDTTPGAYNINIAGTGGGIDKSTNITVNVNKVSPKWEEQ